MGHRNPQVEYHLNGQPVKSSNVEKDLGVYVSKDLKPSYHIGTIVKKANRMVGLIKRNFVLRISHSQHFLPKRKKELFNHYYILPALCYKQ